MQRKGMFALALVFCLASYAQAALTITVPNKTYPAGSGVVTIPVLVSGIDPVHGMDLIVQLGGSTAAVAPFGAAPPVTYQGSEQFNVPGPGLGAALLTPSMWDAHANTWGDSTDGLNDGVPSIPGSAGYGSPGTEGTWFSGTIVFNGTTAANGQVIPDGLALANLEVNLTGFGPGTWPLLLGTGHSGTTDFVDRAGSFIGLQIVEGSVTITGVPEPASVVLGLFAAAGLGIVAIRKRRAARA